MQTTYDLIAGSTNPTKLQTSPANASDTQQRIAKPIIPEQARKRKYACTLHH